MKRLILLAATLLFFALPAIAQDRSEYITPRAEVFAGYSYLAVYGVNFDQGAKLYLNGAKQKTANDETNPTTKLICKKAGKKIARGQTVMLQVKTRDGRLSNGLMFTRPAP